jgi:hypothetical protein
MLNRHVRSRISLPTLVLLGAGSWASAALADTPAVSAPSGKLSLQGGSLNSKGASSADGVLSLPVGQLFGLQLDASSGRFLEHSYSGLAGHFFWRDPSRGLAGLTSSHQKLGSQGNTRSGVEGEVYLNNYTVILRGGAQSGDGAHGSYQGVGLRWYLTDNLSLNMGFDHSPGIVNTSGVGVEWQPANWTMPGLALFARGTHSVANQSIGNSHAVGVGVRYYFGTPKSLLLRHRRDDPDSIVMPLGDVIPTPSIVPAAPAVVVVAPPEPT